MPEPVFHVRPDDMPIILEMPKATRGLWFDLLQQAKPDKRVQFVRTDAAPKVLKPLIDAGFIKPRTYSGQDVKGSFVISPDHFYCTSEPTIGEIWLSNTERETE